MKLQRHSADPILLPDLVSDWETYNELLEYACLGDIKLTHAQPNRFEPSVDITCAY